MYIVDRSNPYSRIIIQIIMPSTHEQLSSINGQINHICHYTYTSKYYIKMRESIVEMGIARAHAYHPLSSPPSTDMSKIK